MSDTPDKLLASRLNLEVPKLIRWCTPSVLIGQTRVSDIYASDVSVSYGGLGSLLKCEGSFADAANRVSRSYRSGKVLLSVNGSSGSNWVIARYLSFLQPTSVHTLPDAIRPVLVARNCHHSVYNALKALGVKFRIIDCDYLTRYSALLPPTPTQVREAMDRHAPTASNHSVSGPGLRDEDAQFPGVILSSPTYEGLSGHIGRIVELIRSKSPGTCVVVDEAWGSHLPFADPGDSYPPSAISLGADIVVHSTHKQGGALQQTGVIHYRGEDSAVRGPYLEAAYREYSTTSPSYHLVASIEAAAELMRTKGRSELSRLKDLAHQLRRAIEARGLDVEFIEDAQRTLAPYTDPSVYDWTKLVVSIADYNIGAPQVAKSLEEVHGIVVEKADMHSLVFLATFQLPDVAPSTTAEALAEVLSKVGRETQPIPASIDTDHFRLEFGAEPHAVSRADDWEIESVPWADADGRISAETIEVYPPGIPMVFEGGIVRRSVLEYLQRVREEGASLVMRRPHEHPPRLLVLRKGP